MQKIKRGGCFGRGNSKTVKHWLTKTGGGAPRSPSNTSLLHKEDEKDTIVH